MKNRGIFYVFVLAFALFPVVSASLAISSPESVYNNGDTLDLTVALSSQYSVNDFLVGEIECTEGKFEVYRSIFSVGADEKKEVSLSIPLDPTLFGNLSGTCDFMVHYNKEERKSQSFEITNSIEASMSQERVEYNPGESILFEGKAVKRNGKDVEGFADINLEGTNISVKTFVINGSFEANVDLPENIPSRTYSVKAKVYEQNPNGDVINEGYAEQQIRVSQIVTKVEFALNSINLTLWNIATFTPLVYDQADEKIARTFMSEIYDSSGNVISGFETSSDSAYNFEVNQSFVPGEYWIRANVDEVQGENQFYVSEIRKLNYTIINESLFVKNMGNVLYDGALRVFIGEVEQEILINLGVGEEREYVLNAPKGYYAIAINDENGVNALGTAFLTGRAISVREYGQIIKGRMYSIIIWLVVILSAVSAVVYYYRKIRKKDYSARTPFTVVRSSSKEGNQKKNSVIESGERKSSSIVVLKIKNIEEIRNSSSNAIESIESVLTGVKLLKGKIQEDNGAWTIAFVPEFTGEKDNNLRAIKAGQRIETQLREHNRRYSQKIKFGIGIHTGEIIVDTSTGRFTSSGIAIIQAKRIADRADNSLLVSEDLRKKTLSTVRVEKAGEGIYKILRIIERGNSPFLERFKGKSPGS